MQNSGSSSEPPTTAALSDPKWWFVGLALLLLISAVLITWLPRVLCAPPSIFSEEDRREMMFQLKAMDIIKEHRAKSKELASSGEYVEAARIRMQIAGAERTLVPYLAQVGKECPLSDEYTALRYPIDAGRQRACEDLLALLYPNCAASSSYKGISRPEDEDRGEQ
jgi:hypothetical protein